MAEYHEFIRFKKSDFFLKSVLKLSKLKKKTKLAGKILMALGWKKTKISKKIGQKVTMSEHHLTFIVDLQVLKETNTHKFAF